MLTFGWFDMDKLKLSDNKYQKEVINFIEDYNEKLNKIIDEYEWKVTSSLNNIGSMYDKLFDHTRKR